VESGGLRIGVSPAVTCDSSLRKLQLCYPNYVFRSPHIPSLGLPSLTVGQAHDGRHGRAHRGHFASYLRAALQSRGRRIFAAAQSRAAQI
jgi:hypothetical protein